MSSIPEKFLCAGFGGQGIIMMGTLLARTAMEEDKQVTFFPAYGPAMRGGTANCSVIVSSKAIASPVITAPNVLIAMNQESFTSFVASVTKKGMVFYNSSLVTPLSKRKNIMYYPVKATEIAEKIGTIAVANMVMLGAFIKKTKVVSLVAVKKSIKLTLPAHKHGLLPVNYAALDRGYALF